MPFVHFWASGPTSYPPVDPDTGRGDGPLAARLNRPPRDFTRAEGCYFPRLADPAAGRLALARVIKFGLPGGAMAGHEYLADGEISALAAYVQARRGSL